MSSLSCIVNRSSSVSSVLRNTFCIITGLHVTKLLQIVLIARQEIVLSDAFNIC